MKPVKIFYIIFVCLLGIFNALAAPDPPPPPTGKEYVPPPPGEPLPIDENIFLLMGIAVLFGIYIIYKHKLKTKTTT